MRSPRSRRGPFAGERRSARCSRRRSRYATARREPEIGCRSTASNRMWRCSRPSRRSTRQRVGATKEDAGNDRDGDQQDDIGAGTEKPPGTLAPLLLVGPQLTVHRIGSRLERLRWQHAGHYVGAPALVPMHLQHGRRNPTSGATLEAMLAQDYPSAYDVWLADEKPTTETLASSVERHVGGSTLRRRGLPAPYLAAADQVEGRQPRRLLRPCSLVRKCPRACVGNVVAPTSRAGVLATGRATWRIAPKGPIPRETPRKVPFGSIRSLRVAEFHASGRSLVTTNEQRPRFQGWGVE